MDKTASALPSSSLSRTVFAVSIMGALIALAACIKQDTSSLAVASNQNLDVKQVAPPSTSSSSSSSSSSYLPSVVSNGAARFDIEGTARKYLGNRFAELFITRNRGQRVTLEETSSKTRDQTVGAGTGNGVVLVSTGSVQNETGVKQGKRGIKDWAKLLLHPKELVHAICEHYKISKVKFVAAIGRYAIYGGEASLYPVVSVFRIIEKVFVPDACRLRLFCKLGTNYAFMRRQVLKLSPSSFEASSQVKAFSDGILGRDCIAAFPSCSPDGPKLKKEYADLRVEPVRADDSKKLSFW